MNISLKNSLLVTTFCLMSSAALASSDTSSAVAVTATPKRRNVLAPLLHQTLAAVLYVHGTRNIVVEYAQEGKDVARFLALYQQVPRGVISMRQADLQDLDARGLDLTACDFKFSCLQGADFRGANLKNGNLVEADVTYFTFDTTTNLKRTNLNCCLGITQEQRDAARIAGARHADNRYRS